MGYKIKEYEDSPVRLQENDRELTGGMPAGKLRKLLPDRVLLLDILHK
jgi:hypothetical protein